MSRNTLCPYCGLRPGTTKDHVVPRCLFPEKLPNGTYLPTVKACAECNNVAKSGDDTFLRDFLAFHGRFHDDQAIRDLNEGPIGRAMKRNQSDFMRSLKNPQEVPMFTPSGIYIGKGVKVEIDGPRFDRAIARMIRGLYFKLFKTPLPPETEFEVLELDPKNIPKATGTPGTRWLRPPALGDVFKCLVCRGPVETGVSLWILDFHGRIYLSVRTSLPQTDSAD